MLDFKNSVAHLDVDVQTAVSVSSIVGENFWKFMYITNETVAALSSRTSPLLVTADTYSDVIDGLEIADADKVALMKKNFASLFDLAPSAQGYIITADTYTKFKYYAYWCYLEAEYEKDSDDKLTMTSKTEALFTAINSVYDKAFSGFVTDMAIDAEASITAAPASDVDDFMSTLGALVFPLTVFARGATEDYEWAGTNASGKAITVGFSPALYQMGRTLGFINSTGTSIGNSWDTVACTFQDVLPSRSTGTSELVNASALFINWCQQNGVVYFKTLGNGTGQIDSYGGWTLKKTCQSAEWIVAYINYMAKVRVAEIMSAMNTYRSGVLYSKCLGVLDTLMSPFITLGRIYNFVITAPSWAVAQTIGDRETIVIPDAWVGWYRDNNRKVRIQGALNI